MSTAAALLLALAPQPQTPPRLVVLVSVDQLIPEQLERLAPLLDGGLGRFWREGTVYRNAALDHAHTETGPGHATLGTGCRPATHGIVGNMFYDRALGDSRYCVSDAGVRAVTQAGAAATGEAVGPVNLRVPALGDHMARAFPGSLTVSVSAKDRSAIGMGGHGAALALWWDRTAGGFASSTAYLETLPGWVQAWNDGWLDAAAGFRWEPSFEGDPSRFGTAPDERPGETPFGASGTTFPHELAGGEPGLEPAALARQLAGPVYVTPLVDRFTLELAIAAVDAVGLGRDDRPDLLAVGLSACDAAGHTFGPYSWEVTDLLLRTDDALGELFRQLDERVGAGRWIAALSADHGVLPLPESVPGARRVGRQEEASARVLVREALAEAFPGDGLPVDARYTGRGFGLDGAALAAAGIDAAAARRVVAEAAARASWVAAAYTLEQLAGEEQGDAFLPLYRNGFDPERSEDVVLRPEPWTVRGMGRGTSHGSPYPYDRRVPLAFLGAPFPATHRFDGAASIDAVPTLLQALGVPLPTGLDGRALPRD